MLRYYGMLVLQFLVTLTHLLNYSFTVTLKHVVEWWYYCYANSGWYDSPNSS